ncbi:hypothetical protein [Zoogloea sp.]|uniref:hypothetical protein n=1 Tax=Zoogloea sp. TaxID=49181 RepID=UPI0035B0F4C5
MKALIFTLLALSAQTTNAQQSFTAEEYNKIKSIQFSGTKTCNTEQVLASSLALGVKPTYAIGGEEAPLTETTDKRLLCLISISTEVNFRGRLKSNPNGPEQAIPFNKKWPENALIERVVFSPAHALNLRCDDLGVPPVIIIFTKTPLGLKRSINFVLSTYECGAGELNNWLKPRPTWLK